jgi:hypothetical protein
MLHARAKSALVAFHVENEYADRTCFRITDLGQVRSLRPTV